MKKILIFSILFSAITLPSLGELSDDDLNRIRLIVKEEVNAEIESFEKDIKEYINTKNESVEKRLSLVTNLIVGLMALIGIPLVVLTVMIGWRSVKDSTPEIKNIKELTREQMKELVLEQMTEFTSEDKRAIEQLIRDQQEKIESLTQEIETLKQQETVNP
ncbi:hypothetical protein F4054_17000 [Candidatus Poribacteria bacterium]|nr:hypothetical protein [Candidatus Poribacteria bacterium]MYK23942.1 hypothetical protein [Candidatus Poribacteria bacterium]